MENSTQTLLEENVAIEKFRKWLVSAFYLPREINRNTEISASLQILPTGDITYKYKNDWHAEIGVFQKEKYQKAYNKIKARKESLQKAGQSNQANELKYPNKKDVDFWVWSHDQGTHQNICKFSNCPLFSFDNLFGAKDVITEFIDDFSEAIFKLITPESLKANKTISEESDKTILGMYLNSCNNHAVKNTPYPGDKQRNIKANIDILESSIKKKYLPVYIMEYYYKKKKFINCCDAVNATCCNGARPRSNYWDEILLGLIGFLSIIMFFLKGVLPVNAWSQKLSIEPSTLLNIFLGVGILGLGYVVCSLIREAVKASNRKKQLSVTIGGDNNV